MFTVSAYLCYILILPFNYVNPYKHGIVDCRVVEVREVAEIRHPNTGSPVAVNWSAICTILYSTFPQKNVYISRFHNIFAYKSAFIEKLFDKTYLLNNKFLLWATS